MLSHTGEKPFICKQCNYLFVYLHIRHPGTSFLRSSYNYIFKNIAYVIVYVWPSRTWDEILLPFQKGLFFPLGDIRLFLPTRIRICAYAHHPTWIRHGRIRMAIPSPYKTSGDVPARGPPEFYFWRRPLCVHLLRIWCWFSISISIGINIRDGHADADDADSCRMMRICAYAYACRQKKSDSAKREKLTFFKRQ